MEWAEVGWGEVAGLGWVMWCGVWIAVVTQTRSRAHCHSSLVALWLISCFIVRHFCNQDTPAKSQRQRMCTIALQVVFMWQITWEHKPRHWLELLSLSLSLTPTQALFAELYLWWSCKRQVILGEVIINVRVWKVCLLCSSQGMHSVLHSNPSVKGSTC